MEPPDQTLPALLYLLCAMSAMAFLVSSYSWLWKAASLRGNKDLKTVIHKGQLYSFLSVMVISICIGIYDHYVNERDLFIGGEAFVLAVALVYAYIKADDENKGAYVLRSAFQVLSFGFFCVFGWGLTMGIGVALTYIFNSSGLDTNVVFITGLIWNVPIVVLYVNIAMNSDKKTALKGYGFHRFLWPVLMAYTVLLIPLLIQQISVSEEWQQMKNEKPMKTV